MVVQSQGAAVGPLALLIAPAAAGDLGIAPPAADMWQLSHAMGGARGHLIALTHPAWEQPHLPTVRRHGCTTLRHGRDARAPTWGQARSLAGVWLAGWTPQPCRSLWGASQPNCTPTSSTSCPRTWPPQPTPPHGQCPLISPSVRPRPAKIPQVPTELQSTSGGRGRKKASPWVQSCQEGRWRPSTTPHPHTWIRPPLLPTLMCHHRRGSPPFPAQGGRLQQR